MVAITVHEVGHLYRRIVQLENEVERQGNVISVMADELAAAHLAGSMVCSELRGLLSK